MNKFAEKLKWKTSTWAEIKAEQTTRVTMSPTEFLRIAPKMTRKGNLFSKEYIAKLTGQIKKSKQVVVPYLDYRGTKLIEHEGRHRAFIMKKLRIKKMPVDLVSI